jgi:hypothetical protein
MVVHLGVDQVVELKVSIQEVGSQVDHPSSLLAVLAGFLNEWATNLTLTFNAGEELGHISPLILLRRDEFNP